MEVYVCAPRQLLNGMIQVEDCIAGVDLHCFAENPTQWTSAGTLGVAMFLSVLLAVILSLMLTVAFHAIKCCNVSDGVLPTLFTLNDDLAILVVCGLAVGMGGGL